MSVLIVCPKDKGNTYHVSRYIADNSDAELLIVNRNERRDLKKYDSIILSSGVYGGRVHKDLLGWLNQIEKSSLHENAMLHIFLTWFGRGQSDKDAIEDIKKFLEDKELSLEDEYMSCYGGKWFIRRSHPDKEDCEKVLDWLRLKI